MSIHEAHFLPEGDIDTATMHCVDEKILAALAKPESMPLLAKSTPLPTIVKIETLSADKPLPIKIDSLTATGLNTVLHQIEIYGSDVSRKQSSIIIFDQELTGEEITPLKLMTEDLFTPKIKVSRIALET